MDSLVSHEISPELTSSARKFVKRWRLAFVTIYCSRAIKTSAATRRETNKILNEAPSFAAIPIEVNGNDQLNIGQTPLTNLVREKDFQLLQDFGGVLGVASLLKTPLSGGIHGDTGDVSRRQKAFGLNTYKKPPNKSLFHFVWAAFKDPSIVILLFCAALSLGFGIKANVIKDGWYEGGSIFVAVFLMMAVPAASNFQQSRQFDKLSRASTDTLVDVIRNSQRKQISRSEIVVGDVVYLKIGDQVPADGLFIDGHFLQVDESAGESDHVEVNSQHNPFLFSGTKIVNGSAHMLVTSVGMNTARGEMMSTINHEDISAQISLQTRVNKLTSSIGKVGLAVALLVFVVLLIRYFTGNTRDKNRKRDNDIINSMMGIIAAAVTIVVVAIPEGLPLAMTLTLAYSMKRMMAGQVMVTKSTACETMGLANVICTNKTGTLTMNQMKVTKFWLGKDAVMENGYSSVSNNVLDLIRDGVALNTTGSGNRRPLGSEYDFSGSPMEKAILSWANLELNMDMEKVRKSCEVVNVEAFNSQKKRSGVMIRKNADGVVVHWKGAAEIVLAMCSNFYDQSGLQKDMTEEDKKRFEQIIEGMGASSLSCIAFAHKQVPKEEMNEREDGKKIREDGLTLLGLIGIKDPCHSEVRSAVQDCQNAGVNVMMITGDNTFTAKAKATECGILRPEDDPSNGAIVEGAEFRNYSPEERRQKAEKIRVMARALPSDKLLMVQCLKQKGHLVAVTGGGTEDAPALKEANIGLCMGIQGTKVAKESSDIIILNDNFASVVAVVQEGRCYYNNVRKLIQFQLTMNVAALMINFVAAVFGDTDIPLTAVQLLWVNLIMDTLGVLALATARPTRELMEKPPVGRTEPLITNIMWRNLVIQALYQMLVVLILQIKGKSIHSVDETVKRMLIFNTFVLCQVFNEFSVMKLEGGIKKNKLFLGIIFLMVILQVVMVELLNKFTNMGRLSWGQWGICMGLAAMSMGVRFIRIGEIIAVEDLVQFS